MAKEQLSDKQQQILEFIKRRILDKGYPPAVREICEAVNLRSTSSVHSHLETLERKGYIHRDPTKPRAIEITDDDFNLARREIINIPVVGTVTAGEPILAVENIEEYFPMLPNHISNKNTFMLHVRGESMINAGILTVIWLLSNNSQLLIMVILSESKCIDLFLYCSSYFISSIISFGSSQNI